MKIRHLQHTNETEVSHNSVIKKRVMIENGELGSITQFARSVLPPGSVAHEHVHHDMAEVFLIDSGQGEILVNGVTYRLEPGTYVVVEPGERHEVKNTGTVDLVLTYFGVLLP